jgi:hypothetical protein
MTTELLNIVCEYRQLLNGNVKPKDIVKAKIMLEGDIRRALDVISGGLRANLYEACPHEWSEDMSTGLVFCKHCTKNNGLVNR